MDDRPWWVRWSPRTRWRVWRWRHSDEYLTAVDGYCSGRVCRFCDRAYAEQRWCDLPRREDGGRYCDFQVGPLRRRRRSRS